MYRERRLTVKNKNVQQFKQIAMRKGREEADGQEDSHMDFDNDDFHIVCGKYGIERCKCLLY